MFQLIFIQNSKVSIQGNALENVCEMAAIVSRLRWLTNCIYLVSVIRHIEYKHLKYFSTEAGLILQQF